MVRAGTTVPRRPLLGLYMMVLDTEIHQHQLVLEDKPGMQSAVVTSGMCARQCPRARALAAPARLQRVVLLAVIYDATTPPVDRRVSAGVDALGPDDAVLLHERLEVLVSAVVGGRAAELTHGEAARVAFSTPYRTLTP